MLCFLFFFKFNQVFLNFIYKDDKDEAVRYYKQGIEEFLLGLAINLSTGAGSSDIERGIHIQEKMENNLRMALERVETLSNHSI